MAVTGESMLNDVDEEVYEGEGDEASMAEALDGDRRAITDAGEIDVSSETETHRSRRILEPPTGQQIRRTDELW